MISSTSPVIGELDAVLVFFCRLTTVLAGVSVFVFFNGGAFAFALPLVCDVASFFPFFCTSSSSSLSEEDSVEEESLLSSFSPGTNSESFDGSKYKKRL